MDYKMVSNCSLECGLEFCGPGVKTIFLGDMKDKPHCAWNTEASKCLPDKGKTQFVSKPLNLLIPDYVNCGNKLIEDPGCFYCGDKDDCYGQCVWRDGTNSTGFCTNYAALTVPYSFTIKWSWATSKVHPEVFGEYILSGPDMKDFHTLVYKNTDADVYLISPSKYGRWCIHGDPQDSKSIALLCSDDRFYFNDIEIFPNPRDDWTWKFSIMTTKLEWHTDRSFKVVRTPSKEDIEAEMKLNNNKLVILLIVLLIIIVIMIICCFCSD